MKINKALVCALSLSFILQSCGQQSSAERSNLILGANVNGRSSIEGVPLEAKLFTNMGYHSDRIKMLIGENLQYHFQSQALVEYLNQSLDLALKSSKPENNLPNVFSYVMKPMSVPEAKIPAENQFDTIKKINELNAEKMLNYNRLRMGATAGGALIKAVPVYGSVLGTAFEKAAEVQIDALVDTQKDLTLKATAAFVKETIDPSDAAMLTTLTPEGLEYLTEKYDMLKKANVSCEGCSLEQQALFQQGINSQLINASKAQGSDIGQLRKALTEESQSTKELGKQYVQLTSDIKKFNGEVLNRMENLSSSQQELNSKVTSLSEEIFKQRSDLNNVKDDVRFMKDFMYSKMSVKEKLNALKSGSYGQNLQKEKRELLEKQLTFQSNLQSVSETLTNVSGILSNLGINNPALAKATQIASVASSLATSLLSPTPDYFSAAMTITGLFGNKKDAAAERHEQIMNKLGVMDQKLDAILENQQKMFDLQVTTLKLLESMSNNIMQLEDKVDNALYGIRINRLGISELLNIPLDNCNQFVDNLKTDLSQRVGFDEFSNIHHTPYMVRQDHFDSYRGQFEKCDELTSQLSMISAQGKISQTLIMAYDSSQDSNSNGTDSAKYDFLKTTYPNSFALLNVAINSAKDQKERLSLIRKYFLLGLGEYKDPKDLLARYNQLFNSPEGDKIVSDAFKHSSFKVLNDMNTTLLSSLESPVSKRAVYQVAGILHQMFYYFDIIKDGKLMTLVDLINSSGRGLSSKGYLALRDLSTIESIAQVQSNIESGYLAFPYIYKNLDKSEVVAAITQVMSKNKEMEKNFKTFVLVNKMMEISKKDLFRQYENVESIRIGAADSFDNIADRIFANDSVDENLNDLNTRLGLSKNGTTFVDFRNGKLVLVLRYNIQNQSNDYTIEIGKMKSSAEQLWSRDEEYESLSQVMNETYSNMVSYEMQPSLYEKYKDDKSVLFNYSNILYQTPMK